MNSKMRPITPMAMAAFVEPDTCASSCAGSGATPHPAPDHFTHLGLSISTLDILPVVRPSRDIPVTPAGPSLVAEGREG